ncbi:MAG TPA: YggS family pyridoxal phosphate-dependent enzyme [Candidatus Eisenbacteria bacterium]|nr:YggS family pyridoxal phosphate-dependent enzyme [Candidatus Eisenbacteria bacterium]
MTAEGPPEISAIRAARALILERIAAAAARARRDPGGVRVVAVTKTVPPDRVRVAVAAGFDLLGENRVQEAAAKASAISGAAWHLIGPLQSNKARRAVEIFDVIQSVDSLDLARRLDRLAGELRPGRPLPVLLQVNVAADPTKAGFELGVVDRDLPAIIGLPALRVLGLMTIGPLGADAEASRPTFVALRELSNRLRTGDSRLGPELSMGMTDDFEVAVEEGATLVRIGRAIFGARPSA